MESLVRNILRLPNEPAIIFVSFFSFKVNEYFDGQESHLPVANYYDTTLISYKNAVYDYMNHHPELHEYYYPDGIHPSGVGHRIAGEFVIHHVQQLICALDYAGDTTDGGNIFGNASLPLVDMWTLRSNQASFRELQSSCDRMYDKTYQPKEMHGWEFWSWQDEKHYITADKPGSNVTFEISTNQGVVALYIFRSSKYSLGDVWCWADDDKVGGTQIAAYWTSEFNTGSIVHFLNGLSAGKHDIHCELLPAEKSHNPDKGTNFRILAIMSG